MRRTLIGGKISGKQYLAKTSLCAKKSSILIFCHSDCFNDNHPYKFKSFSVDWKVTDKSLKDKSKQHFEEATKYIDSSFKGSKQDDITLNISSSKTKAHGVGADDSLLPKFDNVQTKLNPTEFKKWTKQQVASLLCAPSEVGGAGLAYEDVKPLYDANFKGTSIDNIITHIKDKDVFFAIEQLETTFKDDGLLKVGLSCTLKSVVFWVEKLFKTRLYHLWSVDVQLNELSKPVVEGGAGLTREELNYLKLSLWKDRMCLKNIEKVELEEDPFLRKLLKEKIDSEKIYEKCLIEFKKRKRIQPKDAFLDDILSYTQQFEVSTLQPATEIPQTIENILHKNLHPLFKNHFNKQYLPYITSLHFGSTSLMCNSGTESNIIVSPSGTGKTARMVKTMCKIPGIYITGTSKSETDNGQTSDKCVKTLLDFLPSDRFEAFACVKQSIQLLLITKLLHVLRVIDEVSINSSLLDPFEGNIFAFITFNQSNENTKMESAAVYSKLISEYLYCEIEILRRLTARLIQGVIVKLKNLQNASTHEWNGKRFVICLDEAHILEEKSEHKFISLQGRQQGLLSVFASEIELLKDKVAYPYNVSSAYAGTSFNVDVSNVVQSSAQKSEANSEIFINQTNSLSKEDFIKFLSLHITLSEEMKENVKAIPDSMFPIIIKQAAHTLQLYLEKENANQLSDCFEDAHKELTNR